MHICFITNEYPKLEFPHGGVGTFIHTISHKLIEKGYKVSVIGINIYTKIDETEQDGEVSIFRLKPRSLKGLTWYLNTKSINKKLVELHNRLPIDIVETAELGLSFIKKNKSIKYVIRLHGGHHFFAESENRKVSWWKGFQEKKSFKNADAFVAVSQYVKSHTAKFLSYNNKPITIIRYPINLEVFKPKPEIEIEPNTILFAGTVCEKKGVNQLLEAMPKVIEQNKDAQLFIYGRDWFFKDGSSYIAYLKNEILPKLGNTVNYVHFMGAVPFKILANKYAAAEICVFPSLMETQGLVAPEAMAMNKLVIFSNCGPGPETIEHKKTGLLCNPYDSDDISKQINWALSHKKDCQHISINARKFVTQTFDVEKITIENIEFYNLITV
ncbi:glycosyltransferase family 4 protein [Winogradskyella sp. PG-2]|uniref:glycosyltransferase family 4 protein n=1 Tax=Winogradskyella sp. PG-2 TaxID=754409 RepID=UPI00045882BA|nr:glycosyltransferase family 4 protein [Winogradskyella sp. PG-2]BAO74395.1 glycosyltransferase [Winogradskyella sp. PG-2]